MPQGMRFSSNEEVITENEAYFESKDESFYKKRHLEVREALEWMYYACSLTLLSKFQRS